MPSSISSSNDRLPTIAPLKTWMFSLVLSVAVLFGIEMTWRSLGYKPTSQDGVYLWCRARERVESASSNAIVLIGHSRLHQAWRPNEFSALAPDYEQIQLAYFTSEPIAVLRDIAENTDYSGIVLCSTLAFSLLPENWRPTEEDPYGCRLVEHYHKQWSVTEKTDGAVRTFWQNHLVLSYPDLAPHRVVPDILRRQWPVQSVWTAPDRMQQVDYDKMDLPKYSERQFHFLVENLKKATEFPSYKTWPKDTGFEELDAYVRMIQSRGGRVVFVRPVTSGEYQERLNIDFPRSRFWDLFARNTSATAIHFEDLSELVGMQCPDGSHLSQRDSELFTRVITRELMRRGIIGELSSPADWRSESRP